MIAPAALARERVWLDGGLHDAGAVQIPPFTHALHYGSAVFEGIRAYETRSGTAVFRLEEHLRRFFASAAVYGLQIPYTLERLCEAVAETLVENSFASGYIRPLAFFGQNSISLAPRDHCPTHVLIALRPLRGSLIGDDPNGCRVTISPWRKTPSRCLPSNVKASGHYTNSILALQDALARGFDEAILLNDRGEIAEGSGENVFIVSNGTLRTNDAGADVLEGITRACTIELARDLGIPVEVGPITVEELLAADEAFFTGTAAEVMPIAAVDATAFPSEHPVTDALRAAYVRATRGEDLRHRDWTSPV